MPRRPQSPPRPGPDPENQTGDAPVPEPSRPNGRRLGVAVLALLSLHLGLAARSLVLENPTIDEVVHLPAGISYWQTGSFRLYHHNPPLVKLLAALPVLTLKPITNYSKDFWSQKTPNKFAFAHEFQRDNAGRYFELFTRARLLMPVFSLIGGLVVFGWSRRLYGPAGGLLSLALWVVCPNVLAHTRLVTTDMGATGLGALATFAFWRYLKAPSWRLATVAGLCLGLAQLTKFSQVVLYGLWPLLALVRFATGAEFRRLVLPVIGHELWVVALSVVIIDLGYGFEGVGIPLGRYELVCQTLTKPVPPGMRRPSSTDGLLNAAYRYRVNRFRDTPVGFLPVPLPEHFLLGFDDQKLEAEGIPRKFHPNWTTGPDGDQLVGYPVYLDGTLGDESWWYYYLMTLLYKVPEGTSLLVLGSLVVLASSRRSRAAGFDEFAVLIVPAFVLFVMSVFTNINLGLRYVLPIFPYLFVSAGKLAPWASGFAGRGGQRVAWSTVGACLAMTAAATASIHPHYLAYFNAASGGPDRGASHLIDSNIDWGQDLVNLRRWCDLNAPGERVGLAYFGQVNPRIFAERHEPFDWFLPPPAPGTMPLLPPRYAARPASVRLRPGLYAVSASLVQGLRWRVYDSPLPGLDRVTRWAPYSTERDAFSYFRRLTPIAKVGYSIWIYRVTPEDAARLAPVWQSARPPA